MSNIDCDALPIPELNGQPSKGVEWDMHLPDFAEPQHIVADPFLVASTARALGKGTLRIVTEAGPVSDRFYDARLSNTNWQPRLGNVRGGAKSVPMVRTIADDTDSFEGRSTDWVIVNTNEMQDRIQEADYLPRSLLGAFVRQPNWGEMPDMHVFWVTFLDRALRQGFRELAHDKLSLDPRTLINHVRVSALTRFTIVHSHRHLEENEPDAEPSPVTAAVDEEPHST